LYPKYNTEDFKEYFFEGLSPKEVLQRSRRWCLQKFYLISNCVLNRQFEDEVFDNPEFGRLMATLSKALRKYGLKTVGFLKVEDIF